MIEYDIISEFYGDRCAARSGVRMMKHIDEGLLILSAIRATNVAQRAWCIHPIVQNDEDVDLSDVSPEVLILALEYRRVANSYLCRPATDYVLSLDQVHDMVGPMSTNCANMLLADKVQNRKDFVKYHRGTHPRSDQLDHYFYLWLEYLDSDMWHMVL